MTQQSFFQPGPLDAPLATRMRPQTLSEFSGQQHLLGEGKILRQLIEEDKASSMIFWGPPGVGKTTLAKVMPYMLLYYGAILTGLMLVTYVSAITLGLPMAAGMIG